MTVRGEPHQGRFRPPRAWKRRTTLITLAGAWPVLTLFVVFAFRSLAGWIWDAEQIGALVGLGVMLAMLVVFWKLPAPVGPGEPAPMDLEQDGDSHRWTGEVPGLTPVNLESVLMQATEVYPRLQLKSVSQEGDSATLTTKAGWSTTGADVAVRCLQQHGADGSVESTEFTRYEVTISPGTAAPDVRQQVDDLTRLVYLLQELASPHAAPDTNR